MSSFGLSSSKSFKGLGHEERESLCLSQIPQDISLGKPQGLRGILGRDNALPVAFSHTFANSTLGKTHKVRSRNAVLQHILWDTYITWPGDEALSATSSLVCDRVDEGCHQESSGPGSLSKWHIPFAKQK